MPTPARPPERICYLAHLRGPGMGDIVQRNIFLGLIRRARPAAHVTVVVGAELLGLCSEVLVQNGPADAVIAAAADAGEDWTDLLRSGRFDVCVVDPGSQGLDAVHAAAAGIPVRIGLAGGAAVTRPMVLPPSVFGRPDLFDYAVALAGGLGIAGSLAPGDVVATPGADGGHSARAGLGEGTVVAVHPGGAATWNRRWPAERYVEICRRLLDQQVGVVLLGGAEEAADLAALAGQLPAGSVQMATPTSYGDLVRFVSSVDLLVGNDSGPGHVAAARGVATVVVYGPTGTEFMWARIYLRHRGVSLHYPCQQIRRDTLRPADAPPCSHHCTVPLVSAAGPYPRCMTDLGVDRVWQAVSTQLATIRNGRSPARPDGRIG